MDEKIKIYVPDTSSIIDNPECICKLAEGGNVVVLLRRVLQELDELKHKKNKVASVKEAAIGANREIYNLMVKDRINRRLKRFLTNKMEFDQFVLLENGGVVCWEPTEVETGLTPSGDNIILETCKYLQQILLEEMFELHLVSEDINLLLKVESEGLGIKTESLKMGKLDIQSQEELYDGYSEIFVDPETLELLFASGPPHERFLTLTDLPQRFQEKEHYWNEGVILIDKMDNKRKVVTKYDPRQGGKVLDLKYAVTWSERLQNYGPREIMGFKPGDPLQILAVEYVLDPEINVLVLDGRPGTGKTRLMISTALYLYTLNHSRLDNKIGADKIYEKVLIQAPSVDSIVLIRPEYSSSDFEVGLVPGDASEKISPWLMPYSQQLKRAERMTRNHLGEPADLKSSFMECWTTALLRGMNIGKGIALIDEVQNGNRHFAKTLMSRFEDSAKGIIAGCTHQIDNKYVSFKSNALSLIKETYKGRGPYIAQITLRYNYRGKISRIADEL